MISVALVDASGVEVAGGVHTLGSPRRHSAMTARGVLRNSAGRQYVARPGRYRLTVGVGDHKATATVIVGPSP